MKIYFSVFGFAVWIAIAQPLLAQSFFVQPSNPQPQIIPQKKPDQNPGLAPDQDGKKPEIKIEEIPAMFRDRAIILVDLIPRGEAISCTLSIKITNLTGKLVDSITPWKCRLTDLGSGVKQVETVIFEKLSENGNPSPAKFRPTYVYLPVGARINSQVAMARQQSQAVPERFLLPFRLDGGFGTAAN